MLEVQWANTEKNIVLWKFSSGWTWNDLFSAQKKVDVMIDNVEGIVDSIFLLTEEQKIPPGAITHFRNMAAKRHHRHDLIVIVGSKTFLSILVKTVIRIAPGIRAQIRYVNSQTEAYTIIEQAQQKRIETSFSKDK